VQLKALDGKGQDYFGVNPAHVSSTDWIAAQFEMSQLDRQVTPTDKLNTLLGAAKAIYNTVSSSLLMRSPGLCTLLMVPCSMHMSALTRASMASLLAPRSPLHPPRPRQPAQVVMHSRVRATSSWLL